MKNPLWSIVTAAIITTLLGCLGFLFTSISDLQKKEASHDALEFTSKDAIVLQQKLTDIMTDIDMRISLIERDIQWIKIIQPNQQPPIPTDTQPPIPTDTQPPNPDPPTTETTPRYDLRHRPDQNNSR